jgi:hypothetical protein
LTFLYESRCKTVFVKTHMSWTKISFGFTTIFAYSALNLFLEFLEFWAFLHLLKWLMTSNKSLSHCQATSTTFCVKFFKRTKTKDIHEINVCFSLSFTLCTEFCSNSWIIPQSSFSLRIFSSSYHCIIKQFQLFRPNICRSCVFLFRIRLTIISHWSRIPRAADFSYK